MSTAVHGLFRLLFADIRANMIATVPDFTNVDAQLQVMCQMFEEHRCMHTKDFQQVSFFFAPRARPLDWDAVVWT